MFIVIEGCEGCGKSTQVKKTSEWLRSLGFSVVSTKEPGGGGEVGLKIRDILLNNSSDIDPMTELFLYSTDRVNHINKIINPSLLNNDYIVCDRFLLSTIAYQGFGRGLDKELIRDLIELSLHNLDTRPHYIWIDSDVEKSLSTIRGKDRVEQEPLEFHKKVYYGYKSLCNDYPSIIYRVNGDQSIDDVQKDIKDLLKSKMGDDR